MRAALEEYCGVEFIKVRPLWFGGLEIDAYSEEMGVGFEYNGQQHYRYDKTLHKEDVANFHATQAHDALKVDLAAQGYRLVLVVIPYTVKIVDIRAFVRAALDDIGLAITPGELSPVEFEQLVEDSYMSQGAPKYDEATNKKMVEEGTRYTFLGQVKKARGKSTAYYFRLQCPNKKHRIWTVCRSDFFPLKDGKPLRECMSCSRERTTQLQADLEKYAFMAAFKFRPLIPVYRFGLHEKGVEWECTECGFTWDMIYDTLKKRKEHHTMACPRCSPPLKRGARGGREGNRRACKHAENRDAGNEKAGNQDNENAEADDYDHKVEVAKCTENVNDDDE